MNLEQTLAVVASERFGDFVHIEFVLLHAVETGS